MRRVVGILKWGDNFRYYTINGGKAGEIFEVSYKCANLEPFGSQLWGMPRVSPGYAPGIKTDTHIITLTNFFFIDSYGI